MQTETSKTEGITKTAPPKGGKQLVKASAAKAALAKAKPAVKAEGKPKRAEVKFQDDHRVIQRLVEDPSPILRKNGHINGDIRDVRKNRWIMYTNGVVVSTVLATAGYGKNAHNELLWYKKQGIIDLLPAGTKVAKGTAPKSSARPAPKAKAASMAAAEGMVPATA